MTKKLCLKVQPFDSQYCPIATIGKNLSKKKQRSKKHVLKGLLYRSSENHSLKMFLIVYFIFKSVLFVTVQKRYKVTEWFRWNILFTFTFFCINLLHKLVADFYTFPVKVIIEWTELGTTHKSILERKTSLPPFS